jgi:hypothetical protein
MAGEKKGKTLWEMFTERFHHNGKGNGNGAALAFRNPLDWRIGEAETFAAANGAEFLDFTFTVKEIRECVRRLGGQEFGFTDYLLRGARTPGHGETAEMLVRVRALPKDHGEHDLLLLRLEDEFAFAEDFLAVVKDSTGVFEVKDDASGAVETFTRLNDLREPWEAAVLIVSATNADGKALPSSTGRAKLEYWDYWREVDPGGGQTTKEFLFVEMNADTGWFQIWRGRGFFV